MTQSFVYVAAALMLLLSSGFAIASPAQKKMATRSYKRLFRNYGDFQRQVPKVKSLGQNGLARNTLVREKMSRIVPSQSEYGRSLIEANVLRQKRKAVNNQKTALEWVEARAIGAAIPAVLSPNHSILVLDSHHGILTNIELLKDSDHDPHLMFKVLNDFRDASEKEFIHGVFGSESVGGMGKGQYQRKFKGQPLADRVQTLPKSFSGMLDNPHRSLVGGALSTFGVQADNLKDYVEFKLINHMLDLDLIPKTDFRFVEQNIRLYANVIYTEPVLSYLRTMLRKTEKRAVFERQLLNATRQLQSP